MTGNTDDHIEMLEYATLEIPLLLDSYGALLTEKTAHVLHLFYEEDLTLSEIAASLGTSRQNIHDTVRRGCASLAEYEDKLGLVERHTLFTDLLKGLKEAVSAGHRDKIVILVEQLDQLC